MRLTYKYEKTNGYGSVKTKNLPPDPFVDRLPYLDDAWQEQRNKLGQLEDIEEELGIDLVKLLSAKKVYYMDWNRDCSGFIIRETNKLFINLTDRTIEYYENEYSEFTFDLEIKNYGKNNIFGGWALTKEELV